MKSIKIFFLATVAIVAGLFTACSDDDFKAGPEVDGAQVYFPENVTTQHSISDDVSSIAIPVKRIAKDEALTVAVLASDESGLFTIPSSVSFAAGKETSELLITFDRTKLEDGKEYPLSFLINDEDNTTPYGNRSLDIIVAPWPWVKLGTGKFRDDYLCSMFNGGNPEIEVTIHEHKSKKGIYMIEERHTDQRDFNFAANIAHTFRNQSVLRGGLTARINRTEYYDQVKDLLGADYWLDVDKFALRDNGNYNPLLSQNDLDYYLKHGEARRVGEGDKFSYDYYANLRQAQVWAQYYASFGGFTMSLGGEVGYTAMWRDGRLRKGLFANNSLGKSKTLDYLTYKLKGEFSYRFSGAHAIDANVAYMVNPPQFRDAFVSARTRNTTTPGLDSEKVLGVDLSYNLNLPWITARVSGYYTSVADQSKVISFYDDTRSSFTNFAMSGIDKRYYGVELGLSVPVWNGLSVVGALSWGDYTYTSNPNFVQTVDNVDKIVLKDKVNWDGYHVESSPQLAFNIGLDYRGPRNWFAGVNFNYYDNIYLSMNPMYRTATAIKYYTNVLTSNTATNAQKASALSSIKTLRKQEKFDSAYTLSANIGKNWYIHRKYTLGFSLDVKNILNNQDIKTGGYEQTRLSKNTETTVTTYQAFDSKYFYMFGTTYYLNLYFRF